VQECLITDLGIKDYNEVWELQKLRFNEKIQRKSSGLDNTHDLFLLEHKHVYTFGKSADRSNLLVSPEELMNLEAKTYDIERGGDITYHGPGQLVAYPIFDLEKLGIGVKSFVAGIEQAIINTIAVWGIEGHVIKDRIGVWIDVGSKHERKIAAIGIKCSRYVTMHGLALNVNTDLSMFNHIVPCGITDKEVTSMQKELNGQIDMNIVKNELGKQFAYIFGLNFKK